MPPRVYTSSRDRILDAAAQLILDEGAAQLTLDTVARKAEVSKGGLMHHFASKDALLEGIMERFHRQWVESIQAVYEATPPQPARMARVLLNHFYGNEGCHNTQCHRLFAAISGVHALQPRLMNEARQTYAHFLREFHADKETLGVSLIVLSTLDGMWWSRVHDLNKISEEEETLIRRELEHLLDEAVARRAAESTLAPASL